MILAGNALAEEGVDASDPTKIYTYVGAGLKYTDYTNDESVLELRATGKPRKISFTKLVFAGTAKSRDFS